MDPGAFHADGLFDAVGVQPGRQRLVSDVVGRELFASQQASLDVDVGGMVRVFVGVDAADHGDSRRWCGYAAIRSTVRPDFTDGRTGRAGNRSVRGLLLQSPIRSDPSGRCAPRRCTGVHR